MNDRSRPEAAPGSGGPTPMVTDATDSFVQCGCVEAVVLWAILSGDAPAPDTAGWRTLMHLVEALALRKLAAVRPMLVQSDMDELITNRFAQLEVLRNTVEIPEWAVSGNAMLARRRAEAA